MEEKCTMCGKPFAAKDKIHKLCLEDGTQFGVYHKSCADNISYHLCLGKYEGRDVKNKEEGDS